MQIKEIKVKNINSKYSIFIGENILDILPKKIKTICPNTRKIGIVIDRNIPKKFKLQLAKLLKKYEIFFFEYSVNEKLKSFTNTNNLIEKCIFNNFNRSDLLIAVGGGIIGDFCGFVASILKRGIHFINLPSTLLAQVDSSIGGKTGVNSNSGKNLIGSFYQPKLVISDLAFLKSLPRREIICGYAEILKHSLILKNNFFMWLKINTKKILDNKDPKLMREAIAKSCGVKLFYVNKDVKEKNLRMILNFGHTFAHAIEAQNKYSKKINHGEAVLMGMMMATKLSFQKKICSKKTLDEVQSIYRNNNLNHNLNNFFKSNKHNAIINFMLHDKKNNDKNINLILLKSIGETTKPGSYKITLNHLKNVFKNII
ncbi:MAG: 3-dehydroquinate synthase/shikimate kinase / 3-dehydroquinate synthase [Pelagibacterales bacterium]|jgi:3-dehydroquinate synthase|nr:3-dehydroquinate synthase/shikimate kinase / 3-dehydroquinate synthase [Pelagibacterales bacterium]